MAEKINQEEIVLKIEKLLPKTKGKFAPEDLAAETGFSLNDINDAVKRLLGIYRAKVIMNPDNGKLMFQFSYPLQKVGKKSFKEVLLPILKMLWKYFQLFYKALTGIILIFYTIVFIILILIVMIAGTSGDRDKRGGGINLAIFSGIIRAIFEAIYFISVSNNIVKVVDNTGMSYKTYAKDNNKGKNFVQSVFQFVFGPDNPPADLYADDKEAIAFIRKVSYGKLTASDIVLLTGLTMSQAEERLALYASKFSGELEISDEGKVVANFENLLNTKTENLEGGQIIYYYNEIDPPAVLTGNTPGRDVAILAMNIFNLIVSYVIINSTQQTFYYHKEYITIPSWVAFGLGWFPFLFSLSFFLIPIFRMPFVAIARRKRQKAILRKKLFYALYQMKKNITFNGIKQFINLPKELNDEAQASLNKLIAELRGDISIDDSGNAIINIDNWIDGLSK
jgi:hypothetical protein